MPWCGPPNSPSPPRPELGTPNLNLHGTGLYWERPAHATGRLPSPRPMGPTATLTLGRIADLGEREGVTFCLENLNTAVDHPGTPFATAADTRALVQAVDNPHLLMNLDLYHAQIGEGNPIQLIRDSLELGRRDPGSRRIWSLRARHRRDQLPRHRSRHSTTPGTPEWSASKHGPPGRATLRPNGSAAPSPRPLPHRCRSTLGRTSRVEPVGGRCPDGRSTGSGDATQDARNSPLSAGLGVLPGPWARRRRRGTGRPPRRAVDGRSAGRVWSRRRG